jgi:hypothetical protein
MPVLEIDVMLEAKKLHEYLPTWNASDTDHFQPELIDHDRSALKF